MANNTENPKNIKPVVPVPPKSAVGSKTPAQRPLSRNVPSVGQPMSRRMAARYQSDMRRQRQLIFAAIAIVVLIVLVFAVGIYQSLIGPNIKTLAAYGGTNVSSGDYFTYRKIVLYKELGQLQNISGSQAGDQQQQIQAQIRAVSSEITDIQNFPVDQPTLERLVSNQLLEREAKNQYNITVSDADLNTGLTNDFALYTPTAQPEQAQSTQTANVIATASNQQASQTASAVTPLPTATPVAPALPPEVAARGTVVAQTKAAGGVVTDTVTTGTPNAAASPAISATGTITLAPTANGTPGVGTQTSVVQNTAATNGTSGLTAAASQPVSPTVAASPTVSATATPAPSATPLPADKSNATVKARQDGTLKSLKDAAGISEDDYKKLWVKPQLLQQKVTAKLISQVPLPGQPYPDLQIHVAHILVNDEQTAKDIKAKLDSATDKNATFTELARQYDATSDKTAASHNGDLGWAAKGLFVDAFWDAASKLNKDQISDPVHTQFGWHVIKMLDKKQNGPMEVDVYSFLTDPSKGQDGNAKVYGDWLKKQVDAAKVTYNTPPTPVPSATALPTAAFTPVVPATATVVAPTQPIPVSTPISGTAGTGATPGASDTAAASPAATTTSAGASTTGTVAGTTASATISALTPTIAGTTSSAATTAAVTTSALTTTASTTIALATTPVSTTAATP